MFNSKLTRTLKKVNNFVAEIQSGIEASKA